MGPLILVLNVHHSQCLHAAAGREGGITIMHIQMGPNHLLLNNSHYWQARQ